MAISIPSRICGCKARFVAEKAPQISDRLRYSGKSLRFGFVLRARRSVPIALAPSKAG